MQRKYGIGFFVAILSIVLLFSFAFRKSNQHAKKEARIQKNIEDCYYIKEKDGFVVVYEGDKSTVYEYTSIKVESLPRETQDAIQKGIKVKSLSQIYGFLENYSS